MKTNYPLQKTIGCQNAAQEAVLAALFLQSALSDSPAVVVRAAVPAVIAKPAIIAQTAKPVRPASAAVTAANNTTGYAFGAIYLNSPAYPISTAIPAISPKAASAAVIGVAAVVGAPAVTALSSPPVVAIKGWDDAITIADVDGSIVITAELPVSKGVGLSGSSKIAVREITPSALQANGWMSNIVYALGTLTPLEQQVATLEQFLYDRAMECEHDVTNTIRNVVGVPTACKKLVITVYPSTSYVAGDIANNLAYIYPQVYAGS